jgi:hypothetical protein
MMFKILPIHGGVCAAEGFYANVGTALTLTLNTNSL